MVSVPVLCWNVKVEEVNSWQWKGISCGCGDVRPTHRSSRSYLRHCCRRLSSVAGSWIRLWCRSCGCSSGQCSGSKLHWLRCFGLAVRLTRKQPGGRQAEAETAANETRWFTGACHVQTNTVNFTSFHSRIVKTRRQQVTP